MKSSQDTSRCTCRRMLDFSTSRRQLDAFDFALFDACTFDSRLVNRAVSESVH
jgi:hypothetical protein